MEIIRIDTSPRLSMAVAYGDMILLSGQVAIDAAGGSVTEQCREILARIDALLAKAGSDKSRLIACQLYLRDITTLPEVNAVWDAWVAPGAAPARTTIEARLARPHYALEIGVTAAPLR